MRWRRRWQRRRQRQRHAQPGVASASGKPTTVGVEVETGLTTATTSHILLLRFFAIIKYDYPVAHLLCAHDAELGNYHLPRLSS
jgi:hypothetical protein